MKIQVIWAILLFVAATGFAMADASTGGPKGMLFFYAGIFFIGGFVSLAWAKSTADDDLESEPQRARRGR